MRIRDAHKQDLKTPKVRQLVAYALGAPDPHNIEAAIARVDMNRTTMILAQDSGSVVGQLIVTANWPDSRDVVIDSMSVAEDRRGEGIGRLLFDAIVTRYPEARLRAETDGDSVGFYHSLGFRIRSLGELYPEVLRYECTYDDTDWKPPCDETVVRELQEAGVRCWISGGWAIDLFLGRLTRDHVDTDVLVCREDQRRLPDVFPGWEIYHTHAPRLRRWRGERLLDDVPNVWLRETKDSPWAFEAMFLDVESDEWVYRRNRTIRGPLSRIGLSTDDGLPYLRPEIQLLYKGGSSVRREKDTVDLLAALPFMSTGAKAWLAEALQTQFPEGHHWLSYLEPEHRDEPLG